MVIGAQFILWQITLLEFHKQCEILEETMPSSTKTTDFWKYSPNLVSHAEAKVVCKV